MGKERPKDSQRQAGALEVVQAARVGNYRLACLLTSGVRAFLAASLAASYQLCLPSLVSVAITPKFFFNPWLPNFLFPLPSLLFSFLPFSPTILHPSLASLTGEIQPHF